MTIPKKHILVIAAHPDDEILGAGGTLLRHIAEGDRVSALILGEGAMSRRGSRRVEQARLMREAKSAATIMGFHRVWFANVPDQKFDTAPFLSLVQTVERYLAKGKPDVVYTHFQNDLNLDHRLTFEAVLTACRPCNPNAPKEIYTFETLSSTEWQSKDAGRLMFAPTHYVDISKTLPKKMEAIKAYATELRAYPHPRSEQGIECLAKYRGMEVGMRAAEAFCTVRTLR